MLTAKCVAASIDIKTGSINWRVPYPISAEDVNPNTVFVYDSAIVIQFSDNRLRSVSLNGSVLWETTACGTHQYRNNSVLVRDCDTKENIQIELSSGVRQSPKPTGEINEVTAADDLPPNNGQTLNWTAKGVELKSYANGTLEAWEEAQLLWTREEGISHLSAVALYPSKFSSTIVILSQLGFAAGLDAAEEGLVLWRRSVEGNCRLVPGHNDIAVFTCIHGNNTIVSAVDVASGEAVLYEKFQDYIARRAAIAGEHKTGLSIHMIDHEGKENIAEVNSTSRYLQNFVWLHYENGGTSVRAEAKGRTIWRVKMTSDSRILKVITAMHHSAVNHLRPPAIRVTGDRQVLFKYTNQDTILILSHSVSENCVYAMLVDGRSGATHEIVKHPVAGKSVTGVHGESWFIYTTWNSLMMMHEVHIADLYKEPGDYGSWLQDALKRTLVTLRNSILRSSKPVIPDGQEKNQGLTGQCATGISSFAKDGYPHILRASSLLTQNVIAMHVTSTNLGLTEPSALFVLDSGQTVLVSKLVLDARSPMEMNQAYQSEFLQAYRPKISLQSRSRNNFYFGDGKYTNSFQSTTSAPHLALESSSHVIVGGLDLLYAVVYPMDRFDSLPHDFSHSTVGIVIAALLISFLYCEALLRKTCLSKSWSG